AQPAAMAGKPDRALASMGVYAFTADFLYAELERDRHDPGSSHDFGKDIIPNLVGRGLAVAHSFEESCVKTTPEAEPYWRDVGTIDAYWAANLDLVMPVPSLDIYDPHWPIWSYQQQYPPAKFVFDDEDRRGMAVDSMVSGGCIVSGATVRRSLLFSNCRVNSFAQTSESVLLPDVVIGRHARLSKVIVDRGCHVPEGLVVGHDPAYDAQRFHRSDGGVTLVTAEMLAKLG
ncbi:MAG TPA: sugar phosphate nucleotidyltransferase, partial [Stellaceae bacterium]